MNLEQGISRKDFSDNWARKLTRSLPRLSVCLLFLAFSGLAGIYSLVTPAFEAPDEVGHFYYIYHFLTSGTLPHQKYSNAGEAHQPPLYYWIAALAASPADLSDDSGAFRPNPRFTGAGNGGTQINAGLHGSAETFPFQGQALALHLARAISILMGALTVALILLLGWRLFPEQPAVGWLAAGLAGFNPQFLFISSAVNNDNLLILIATAAWLQSLRTIERPEQDRQWLYLGILTGFGMLAKLNGLVIGVVAVLVLLYHALRRRSLRSFFRGMLWMALPVVLIAGWWFWRNQQLYGDPLGWSVYTEIYAANQRQTPLVFDELLLIFQTQFYSFWGVFGWANPWAPGWFFRLIKFSGLLGLAGLGIFALRDRLRRPENRKGYVLALLGTILLVQELFLLGIISGCNASCYQGRYLFPVIGPAMILVSLGFVSLFPPRFVPVAHGFTLVLFSLAIFMPFQVIRPAYASVAIPKWRLWTVPHQAQVDLDGQIALRGHQVKTKAKGPHIELVLYWQVLRQPEENYFVKVSFLDTAGRVVTEKSRLPGSREGYPPEKWWAGDIIADHYLLQLPTDLAPGPYRFQVSMQRESTLEPLRVLQPGQPVADHIILDWSSPPR